MPEQCGCPTMVYNNPTPSGSGTNTNNTNTSTSASNCNSTSNSVAGNTGGGESAGNHGNASTGVRVESNTNETQQSGLARKEPITIGNYEVERTLGKGNFAVVKLARHIVIKSKVAIKIIDKTKLDRNSLVKMYREIRLLKSLRHPNIIALYQVMETDKMLYVVSEYVENGELFEYITKHGRFREPEARSKFVQVLKAVEYCHSRNVVHRDLKVENLLLDANFNIKLADFGFGTTYQSGQLLNTWCGSPPYAAPEMFLGKEYNAEAVDVWSLGVVLYVMLCGFLPFDAPTLPQLKERVLCGRFQIPFFMSCECEQLIRRMLTLDPKRRAQLREVRQSKWIQTTESGEPSMAQMPQTLMPNVTDNGRKPYDTAAAHAAAQYSTLDTRFCDIRTQQNEQVLKLMQMLNISCEKTLDSLRNDKYDDYTAVYLMLCERVRKHRILTSASQQLTTSNGVFRRPSAVADQAIQSSSSNAAGCSARSFTNYCAVAPVGYRLERSSAGASVDQHQVSEPIYDSTSAFYDRTLSASSASTAATNATSGRGTTTYSTCESGSIESNAPDTEHSTLVASSSISDAGIGMSPLMNKQSLTPPQQQQCQYLHQQPDSANLFSAQLFNNNALLSLFHNASHFNAFSTAQPIQDGTASYASSSICNPRSSPYAIRRNTVTNDARVRHSAAHSLDASSTCTTASNAGRPHAHAKLANTANTRCRNNRRVSTEAITPQQLIQLQQQRLLLQPQSDRFITPVVGDDFQVAETNFRQETQRDSAMDCDLQSTAQAALPANDACGNYLTVADSHASNVGAVVVNSPYSSMTSAMQNLTFTALASQQAITTSNSPPLGTPVALPTISVSPPAVDASQTNVAPKDHPQDVAYDYYAHRDRSVSYSYGQQAVMTNATPVITIRPGDIPLVSVFALRNRRIARKPRDSFQTAHAHTPATLSEEPHDDEATMVAPQ